MAAPVTSSEFPPGEEKPRVFHLRSRPIRTVLLWQVAATAALALLAGYFAGRHGALSAALGGGVSIAAGLVFVLVASFSKAKTVEATLFGALRAEAAKVGAIVVLLWLVFATYAQLVAPAFLAAFVVTVVIFSLAFFVRDV